MKRPKILLIYVQDYLRDNAHRSLPGEELNLPLGILHLGSYLAARECDVKLLDTRLYSKDDFYDVVKREIDGCLLVGLSVMTPCIKAALEITRSIKDADRDVKIVWGGIHPTLYPENTARSEHVDYVIVKEGEQGLLALAEHLSGRERAVREIPNLVFVENGDVLKNEAGPREDLAAAPVPEYALLDMPKYIDRVTCDGRERRQAEMITSRGCPHTCAFCVNTVAYNSKWRAMPPERTLQTLDHLIKTYRIGHIFFMDEDFFCDRKRTKELIKEIGKRGVTWEGNCRADYIGGDYLNEEILPLIKESGCVKLRLGLESGSDRILKALTKGITVERSLNAVRRLTEYGILPSVSFMIALPVETRTDVIATAKLIMRLYEINPDIDIVGPLIFRPYPGSELFKGCVEKGFVVPDSLNEWADFYMHNMLEEYKKGLPWFPDTDIIKKMWLFEGYLRRCPKRGALAPLIKGVIKFHLFMGLRLIDIDYAVYKFFKMFKKPFCITRCVK